MATNKIINPTNVTVQIPEMTDKPNQSTNSNCLDKIIDGVNAVNSKVENIQKGTFYLPNSHCVYAGRNGWSGLNIRISIPIGKGAVGISSATINLGGASVYACTANSVVDITSRISSIACSFTGTYSLTQIAVTIVLESNPLSFSDGIVNISINGGTPTITFA